MAQPPIGRVAFWTIHPSYTIGTKEKSGRFYAGKNPESDDPDVVWDTFYLYGRDAKWIDKPDRQLSTGMTVRNEFDTLKSACCRY